MALAGQWDWRGRGGWTEVHFGKLAKVYIYGYGFGYNGVGGVGMLFQVYMDRWQCTKCLEVRPSLIYRKATNMGWRGPWLGKCDCGAADNFVSLAQFGTSCLGAEETTALIVWGERRR